MPQPRLIDPAVFYDIVKIRRAVDEATEDSVRATTGVSNTALNNSMGRLDPFGGGGGNAPKMSKERIFKIRQKAVRALAKAYSLDEVAASVATMQSTSSLEDVALHVLRRDKTDMDARYVHFFHEKIPSRQMEHFTPLEPLTDIIMSLPWEMQGAPLRTRALVQIFKGEHEGAVNDLTLGLRIAQELKIRHKPGADQLVLAKHFKEEQEKWNKYGKDWRQVPQLKEEDQPSSLEQQMLFNRAGVYLTIACQHVHAALDGLKEYQQKTQNTAKPEEASPISNDEKRAHLFRLETRKRVKTYAKRALKDYLAFLAHFDYTPGLPVEITEEIMRRVYDLANGNRQQTPTRSKPLDMTEYPTSSGDSSSVNDALIKHQKPTQQSDSGIEWDADGWPRLPMPEIHPASALFAATPLPNLPVFPDPNPQSAQDSRATAGTRETITYHPLITDSLHSLLLAHSLLQTSSAELLRHAHNAARLARLADGYPIFQAARSPARADWIEVLRRANNWIGLAEPWQKLCQPAPLPGHASTGPTDWRAPASAYNDTKPDAVALKNKSVQTETEEQKRERRKQEAILDALADERVVDEESFQRAVRAREKRAIEDEEGLSGPLNDKVVEPTPALTENGGTENKHTNGQANGSAAKAPLAKRWAQDDGKEYPISTERAEAIARWIREAPLSMGVKKKRPTKKKVRANAPGPSTSAGAAKDMQGLSLDDRHEEEEVD